MSLLTPSSPGHPRTGAEDRRRRLVAARVAGATAVALVGQVAVDMPDGYFGPTDQMTVVGIAIAAVWLSMTGALLVALRRSFQATLPWSLAFLALGAILFVPAVGADPLIAGSVVLWHLASIAMVSFPLRPPSARVRHAQGTDEQALWRLDIAPAQRHLALMAVALTVAVVGYGLSGHPLAWSVCALLQVASLLAAAPFLRSLVAGQRRSLLMVALPALGALVALLAGQAGSALVLLLLAQLVLLPLVIRHTDLAHELVQVFFRHPSGLLAASFLAVILVGTLFLTFPAASAGPKAIAPLDALFTATSATCVTGLIVLDTPQAFSPFGLGVILVLIQVGGLGIMVLSTYAMLLLGGNLGLRGEHALSQLLESQSSTAAYGLTRFIVVSTLAIEAVGAVLLGAMFWRHGSTPGEAAWLGVFHSVSAFCNAGFALFSDSLVSFQGDVAMLLVVGALIVLGGLGFIVLFAVWQGGGFAVWRRRGLGFWRRGPQGGLRSLSVQVRAVMMASAVLLVAGWVLYGVLEWHHSLAGLGSGPKIANAFFQSVTLRTAGFNSVDFTALSPAASLAMMVFMFIGASPGSTGGGIKTTTLVVLLAATFAIGRGGVVHLFDREVPRATVYRALAILMASASMVLCTFFLLLAFESRVPFQSLLFEAVSAVGTVGLSLGATAQVGPMGKLVIIVAMFVGRVGPLTLALILGTAGSEQRIRHARARIMVG